MSVQPVIVSFKSKLWIRAAVRSYLRYFPNDTILVIDNNPKHGERDYVPECDEEREWLQQAPGVLLIDNPYRGKDYLFHGYGLDTAIHWCRREGRSIMLHFEPDCLISGRRWYANLQAAIDGGAWMAGSHALSYGPIHPTPSMWRVDHVPYSFRHQSRRDDERHPRFHDLVDVDELRRSCSDHEWEMLWATGWDTAQRNWFYAACRGKARLVTKSDTFTHYWRGSQGNAGEEVFRRDPLLMDLVFGG